MPLNDNRDSSMERLTPTLNNLSEVLRELTKVVGDLEDIGDGFTKDVGKSASALKDTSKAFEKENSTLDKTLQKHGAKFDGYAKAAVQSLSAVFSFALNKFEKGFNSIVDNFNQNFTAITSRQQYTQRQYASMLNGFTKWVETHDLRTQFSQIDLSNALIPVLQTGIRGGLAEEMAKRNVVTEKLLPMINTNTRAYMRMSKLFGDTFTQGITAIGTYTERYLQSAEGLEEGNLDSIIQTIYRELGEVAKTPEQFNKMMQETIASYQIMASKYGADYAGTALQNYSKWISGEGVMSGDLASILPGKSASNRSFDAFGKAMETIFSTYIDGRMPSGYGASAFGFSKEAIQDYMIGQKFNKEMTVSMDEVLADFDASAEYQKDMYTLSQGAYNSITEQQNKFNENAMAYLGTLAAENIPDVQGSLNLIKGIVGAFFTAWLTSRTIDKVTGGGSGGGVLKSFSTQWGDSKALGQLAKEQGISRAAAAKELGLTRSAAGTAGGVALLAAGLIKGGVDSWSAIRNTSGGTGAKVASGFAGFFGDTSGAQTQQEKLDEVRKNKGSWLDWKKAGKAAGTGALIGAGTGAIVGSGAAGVGAAPGAAIGGAIGAVAGVVGSLVEQAIQYGQASRYAKSELGKLGETTKEAVKELQNYRQEATQQIDAAVKYQEIQEKLNKNSSNLSDIEKLRYQIQLQQYQLELSKIKQEIGTSNDVEGSVDRLLNNYEKAQAQQDVYSILSSSNITSLNLKKRDLQNNYSYSDLLKDVGITDADAKRAVEAATKSGLLKSDYAETRGTEAAFKALVSGYFQANTGASNIKGYDYDKAFYGGAGFGLKRSELKDQFEAGAAALDEISQGSSAIFDFAPKLASLTKETIEEQGLYDTLRGMLIQHYEYTKKVSPNYEFPSLDKLLSGLNVPNDVIEGYKGYLKTNGTQTTEPHYYKLGAFNILRDGLHSVLHAGEMVLPASASEDLRELSGAHSISGVSSFLKSLLGLSKATPTASALPDTSTVDTLTSAIEAQTQALSKILNSILDKVANIDGMMDGQLRRNLNQGNVPEMVRSWFGFPLTEN